MIDVRYTYKVGYKNKIVYTYILSDVFFKKLISSVKKVMLLKTINYSS